MPNEFTAVIGTATDATTLAITTGGTEQSLLAADGNRRYLLIQNLHASSSLWINFDGVAAVEDKPSVEIGAGVSAIWPQGGWVPRGEIRIIGPTTGQKFTCKSATGTT